MLCWLWPGFSYAGDPTPLYKVVSEWVRHSTWDQAARGSDLNPGLGVWAVISQPFAF